MPTENDVFNDLDPVQRYALGSLSVLLLHHSQSVSSSSSSSSTANSSSVLDMNALAFARTQSLVILDALKLRSGQKEAILALDPSKESLQDVLSQCVSLVGNLSQRLSAVQGLLTVSVASGLYDARSRAFLGLISMHLEIAWPAVAALEFALAAHLFQSQAQAQHEPLPSNSEAQKQEIDVDENLSPYYLSPQTPIDSEVASHSKNQNGIRDDCEVCETPPDTQPQSVGNPFASPSSSNSTLPFDLILADTNKPDGNPFDSLSAVPSSSSKPNGPSSDLVLADTNKPDGNPFGSSSVVPSSSANPNAPSSIYDLDEDDSSLPSIDQLKSKKRREKQRVRKAIKIGGITLVGGVLFGLTGGLIAPALLTALAGVGVTSAASLAASGTLASGAVVGGLFGVAGGGFTLRKARNRISTNLDEFDFERPDDERVLAARAEKEEEEKQKELKRLSGQDDNGENKTVLAIEDSSNATESNTTDKDGTGMSIDEGNMKNEEEEEFHSDVEAEVDVEKELPAPTSSSPNSTDDELKHKGPGQQNAKKKSKRKSKVKVGARGLEAVSNIPSLHLCICVPAWLGDRRYGSALEQFEPGLQAELPYSQHIAVRWESTRLYEMGLAFAKFWASKATVSTIQQAYPHALAAASSVAGAVAFAFAVPLTVMSCMDYIDNPWSILVSRSNGAGEELANVLVERSYGKRPVSLFGYSIGARVIFKALECLKERNAIGIVQDVFLLGAPVTADPERWRKIRPVVAGRLVNAYGSYDWALAFLHRGCGHGVYVSGLRKVDTTCVENLNLAYLGIEGHQELNSGIFRAMHAMGVGLGYITMPPAKLVIRGGGKIGLSEQKVVCEEPGGAEWAINIEGEEGEGGGEGDDENTEQGNESTTEEEIAHGHQKKSKSKSKSKKRRPWGWLYGSSSNSNNNSSSNGSMGPSSSSKDVANILAIEDGPAISRKDATDVSAGEGTLTISGKGATDVLAVEGSPSIPTKGATEVSVVETVNQEVSVDETKEFDWDLQRRIWEEQERQISERGYEYADSARVIELQGRLMLNVSVEVAGRRLERLLPQDSTFPISTRTHVFTNCADRQKGMQIRIYEHEPRTKGVANNMHKWAKTHRYPKLLADLELRLKHAKPKGSLRVQVSVAMDTDGNVHVSAHEFFDHTAAEGNRVSAVIEKEKLCSTAERVEMEAEELKKKKKTEKERLRIDMPPATPEKGQDAEDDRRPTDD